MRGATANCDSSASSTPPSMKTRAARAHGYCSTDPLGLETISSSTPHPTDTQVCAANRRAAIPPARAGVGRCANSSGTTRAPRVVRLPHHSAAAKTGRRCTVKMGAAPPKGTRAGGVVIAFFNRLFLLHAPVSLERQGPKTGRNAAGANLRQRGFWLTGWLDGCLGTVPAAFHRQVENFW